MPEFTVNIPTWAIIAAGAIAFVGVVIWRVSDSIDRYERANEAKVVAGQARHAQCRDIERKAKQEEKAEKLNTLFPGSWKHLYDLTTAAPSKIVARTIFHEMHKMSANKWPKISLEAAQMLDKVLEEEEGGITFSWYLMKHIHREDFVDPKS